MAPTSNTTPTSKKASQVEPTSLTNNRNSPTVIKILAIAKITAVIIVLAKIMPADLMGATTFFSTILRVCWLIKRSAVSISSNIWLVRSLPFSSSVKFNARFYSL